MFVATSNFYFSRQISIYRDKHVFVAKKLLSLPSKDVFCHDKSKLVVTKLLSRQNYFGRDKYMSRQKFCRDKNMFVATNMLLSRQKDVFCRGKHVLLFFVFVFVATKIIPVAAPCRLIENADHCRHH